MPYRSKAPLDSARFSVNSQERSGSSRRGDVATPKASASRELLNFRFNALTNHAAKALLLTLLTGVIFAGSLLNSSFFLQEQGTPFSGDRHHRSRRHFLGRYFRLVGDQPAQERNEQNERDTYHETTRAEFGEKLHILGVGRDRRCTVRLGDHAREVAREERREARYEHPTAHHDPLILLRRDLADHRVSDRHDEQLTDALQHVAQEQPAERTLTVSPGQLDPKRENEEGERHQEQRGRKLLRDVDPPPPRAHAGEERREQRPTEHDADSVDVLDPLRLNLHGTYHEVDVVDREQHQAARCHLI